MGLTRERLICLALLVGCDYTAGVPGIGAVGALEILAEFACEADDDSDESFTALRKFAQWHAELREQSK